MQAAVSVFPVDTAATRGVVSNLFSLAFAGSHGLCALLEQVPEPIGCGSFDQLSLCNLFSHRTGFRAPSL